MCVRVQSPQTTVSCDVDSDSSHVTGSCSPSDSVHDVMPRAARPRRSRLSRSLFPPRSPDVVQPTWTSDVHQSTAEVAPSPLSGWCPPALVVDRGSVAGSTAVLPELLGSYAYCRLAAAAAASIAGIYWGRRCDDKPASVDLMLPWTAAGAGFALPSLTSSYSPSADDPVSAAIDSSPCVKVTTTDDDDDADIRVDRSSGSSSPDDDDLPLDLSPVAKRVRVVVDSPPISVVAGDACSV